MSDGIDTNTPDFRRFRTALLRGQPDRVPLAEVLVDHEMKEAFLGEKVTDVEADLRFWMAAGYDYVLLGRRIAGFPPFWNAAGVDNYYEVQARRSPTPGSRGPVADWHDYRNYPWMTPADLDFAILDQVPQYLPPNVKVVRYLGPIFQVVWMLMGFDTFAFALRDDPKLVQALFDKVGQLVLAEFYDAVARPEVGAVWFLDDVGIKTGLMVNPEVLRHFQFPFIAEMAGHCRTKGVPFIYHTDGDVRQIIPELIEMGVCALHPLEPLAVDIYELKRTYGQQLCLIGNIELASVLALGTVDQVIADTKRHLRELAPGGGYCLGSSNSVTRDVPLENYRAMIDTVKRYGEYPIRD